MLIEALTPLKVRVDNRELLLDPGQPQDLSDEDARRLLAKVPGKVRVVTVPAGSDPLIGRVVMIEDQAGRRRLGVVISTTVVMNAAGLKAGRWYEVGTGGHVRRVHESLLTEREPVCPWCHTCRWWWTPQEIFCARCHPVSAGHWSLTWRVVARLTDGVTHHDPCFPVLMRLLDRCDEAFHRDDYPTFQEMALQLRWVMTSPEAIR